MNRHRRRHIPSRLIIIALFLMFGMGIGYAAISTTLTIDGTSDIDSASWDIHFANVQVTNGSVTATTPSITDDTTVSFTANLANPGDFYEFTVDVVNAGTLDAKLDAITILPNLTNEQKEYFNYVVVYRDCGEININDKLLSGTTESLLIRFEYKTQTDTSLYPTDDVTFNFSVSMTYVQGTGNDANHHSFATDDWATIINIIQEKKYCNVYNVGDTKEITLSTFGTHTIRIANESTPVECSTTGFSQTTCGFVIEFADIITEHRMNPVSDPNTTDGYGNKGGWRYSEMRTYVNNTIYNSLPTDLKNIIIDTTVVSGHGSNDSNNFTTTDKLYLFSTKEILNNNPENLDTAANLTRQLDYYNQEGTTNDQSTAAIKNYNGTPSIWWLRSTRSNSTNDFYRIHADGASGRNAASYSYGVSPGFRIA